jgi:hypothetical protein
MSLMSFFFAKCSCIGRSSSNRLVQKSTSSARNRLKKIKKKYYIFGKKSFNKARLKRAAATATCSCCRYAVAVASGYHQLHVCGMSKQNIFFCKYVQSTAHQTIHFGLGSARILKALALVLNCKCIA